MLAQSTDSGQLIAAAVIKLFHAMKLQVQEMRGIGIQVQLLDGHHSGPQDSAGPGSRSIKQMFLRQGSGRSRKIGQCKVSVFQVVSLLSSVSSITPLVVKYQPTMCNIYMCR